MNAVSLESRAKLNTYRSFLQTSGCVSLVEGAAVIFQPLSPSRVTLKSGMKPHKKTKTKVGFLRVGKHGSQSFISPARDWRPVLIASLV